MQISGSAVSQLEEQSITQTLLMLSYRQRWNIIFTILFPNTGSEEGLSHFMLLKASRFSYMLEEGVVREKGIQLSSVNREVTLCRLPILNNSAPLQLPPVAWPTTRWGVLVWMSQWWMRKYSVAPPRRWNSLFF